MLLTLPMKIFVSSISFLLIFTLVPRLINTFLDYFVLDLVMLTDQISSRMYRIHECHDMISYFNIPVSEKLYCKRSRSLRVDNKSFAITSECIYGVAMSTRSDGLLSQKTLDSSPKKLQKKILYTSFRNLF